MRKYLFFLILLLVVSFFPDSINAEELDQFVTIVNPVRVSSDNINSSLKAEYTEIKKRSLPATWLLTYDALDNPEIVFSVKNFDPKQEVGIFLEVTNNFSNKAKITYNNTGFWHHANAVFLSGYSQEERIKLIDEIFGKFKNIFGYYPKSVGSWWTDSYSLVYLKDKYGVTSNLGCSDQFSTDGYKIWGQYWSTPYYPSKYHTGIPASNKEVKLDLVEFQWAPRDPLNGYYNSLYSTQDYLILGKKLDTGYFEKLVNLYAFKHNNKFGQITIGLETDLGPDVYRQEYAKQLDVIKKLVANNSVRVTTMENFSDWYRKTFTDLSPVHKIESDDLLGSKTKVVWYQSPNYRLSYEINETREIKVRDLRIYNSNLIEPYYVSPNRQFDLSVNINSVLDEVDFKERKVVLPKGSEIITEQNMIKVKASNYDLSKVFRLINLPFKYDIKNGYYEFTFSDGNYEKEGEIIRGYSSEAVHFFKQKKAALYLLVGKGWNFFKKVNYLISQEEMIALTFLSNLSDGKVLVPDRECLQCEYHTKYKPPVFANFRNYIQTYGKHKIVANLFVFNAKTREESKKEFDKLKVKYIYLVKFENYKEELPFSPGDLGVEKIFENANVTIWMVK